jgi:hypothetical protein
VACPGFNKYENKTGEVPFAYASPRGVWISPRLRVGVVKYWV